MAFYTCRVDDAGREIERRTMNVSVENNSLPATPCTISRTVSYKSTTSGANTKRSTSTITYINAAACIEKFDTLNIDEDCEDQVRDVVNETKTDDYSVDSAAHDPQRVGEVQTANGVYCEETVKDIDGNAVGKGDDKADYVRDFDNEIGRGYYCDDSYVDYNDPQRVGEVQTANVVYCEETVKGIDGNAVDKGDDKADYVRNFDNEVGYGHYIDDSCDGYNDENYDSAYMDTPRQDIYTAGNDVDDEGSVDGSDDNTLGREVAHSDGSVHKDSYSDGDSCVESLDNDNLCRGKEIHKNQGDEIINNDSVSCANLRGSFDDVSVDTMSTGIIPSLDLQSNDYNSTSNYYPYDYAQQYGPMKLPLGLDDAHKTWLSAKRKLMADEAKRRREAEEERRNAQEARKRLSEQKLKEWYEAKARQQALSRQNLQKSGSLQSQRYLKSQISKEEAKAQHEYWERKKRLEEEQRRQKQIEDEKRRRDIQQKRRQLSAEAFEKWVATADRKPKPVPANRGLLSLRGTVSDIYINPNEWQSTLPEKKD